MFQTDGIVIGASVRVLNHLGEFVDDAEVLRLEKRNNCVGAMEWKAVAMIEIKSLRREPGATQEMLLVAELGWVQLISDPFNGVSRVPPLLTPEMHFSIEIL
jgi:hypothetical protein